MVARLEPPVQGSTVERNYSTNGSNHWSNPTAVKSLNLTAINFPLLPDDSPELNSNPSLKYKNPPKPTMKNTCPPTLAPCVSRSASNGEDLDAFDDNVDYPAPLGASPVPPGTPTHPALYHGASIEYGSPNGKSPLFRLFHSPSPYTTPDDDQDQPTKKKRRTSNKKRNIATYPDVNSFDNFNKIIQEDRNLHYHGRNTDFAAPIHQGTNINHRATPTKKAAKMQATTTTTSTIRMILQLLQTAPTLTQTVQNTTISRLPHHNVAAFTCKKFVTRAVFY
ncbi:hypothetical protein MHU86_14777 [Fragilaria crotonensis]|nr:hypothetical protein MHU86_14777 [Fragilaria crotonensis]